MWKRSQSRFGDTPAATTPYQKAAQVWDNRVGSARVQAKNWRLAALLSLGLSGILAVGMIWMGSTSRITPYVVEVQENGAVKAVGPAQGNFAVSDAQIAHQLAGFIKNVRSVSIDPVILRQNWLTAYDYATDQAAHILNAYANENNPFANVGHRSVTVDVTSIVRASDDSFDIRWRETSFENGVQMTSSNHTAVISIIIKPPTDAATLHKNPLGLYVHGLNWSQDLITDGVRKSVKPSTIPSTQTGAIQ